MKVHRPRYGRFLEEFEEGGHWWHPRSVTVRADLAYLFAATFMEADPLYLADGEARRAGFERAPLHPLLVLNLALALGVENDSEQALAHLGYRHLRFLQPVYPGATLRSGTRVLEVRSRGEGEPGVVRVETVAVDGEDVPVLAYQRAILVPRRPAGVGGRWAAPAAQGPLLGVAEPPWRPRPAPDWPGPPALEAGDVVLHPHGRTVTDEHVHWSCWLGNTHPLHYDRRYASGREGPLSGGPVVYGGLVFAWVAGLASRDVGAAAVWELGCDEGYHTSPVRVGDTLYAATRVEEVAAEEDGTVLTCTLVGLRDLEPERAWDRYGPALFRRERDKPAEARIEEKCFEVVRRTLFGPGGR